ncbi:hypothetical protein [Aquabacterium sp.]|uniref:hypothetical protein n=1 Tax=Aquabacterium sp. TaxID=1872578 RepID=UPI002487110F|nr:hypothetical protein [Aquabacterium sp.]MDI1350860.1 hypothetical protein [Aquabacterium sp.]
MRLTIYIIGSLLALALVGAALQSADYVGLLVASVIVFYATHVAASTYPRSLPLGRKEVAADKTKPNIVLARHIVLIALICLFQPQESSVIWGGYEQAVAGSIGTIFTLSSALTALAWLFFTNSQTGRWRENFSTFAWTLTVLFVIAPWVVRLTNGS